MKCTKCNGYGYIDNLEGDGLKCPKCNGTGEYEPFDTDVELDKLYPTEQTNEEWFCNLSTEEKAKWIATQCGNAVMESTYDVSKLRKKMYWLDWLKEKHNGV